MRRVLVVSSLWPPTAVGGAELYAYELSRRLRGRGLEVAAVTLGIDAPDVVAQVPPVVYRLDEFASRPRRQRALHHASDLYRPATARTLRQAIARFQPDVVHSHSIAGLSSAALSEPSRLGVPHVHTLHDYWLLCQRTSMARRDGSCETRCRSCATISRLRLALARRGFPDVVVAPSEAIAREHAEFPPVAERVRVVLHPVEQRAPTARDGATPVAFGYLGQLTELKGVRTLLRAFTRLEAGSASLMVAGRGPLATEVEAAQRAGVRYAGWLDEDGKESFFDAIDCLVVPSEWREPAPLVINEAKARGIPVLGAAIGGIPELVPTACRRLLCRSADEDDLLHALERFVAEPSAFKFEPPPDSWDQHLDEILRAYRDAAARRT